MSKEVRTKSRFCNIMHWSVIIIQFFLFGLLLLMLILGSNNHLFSRTIFTISSVFATIIMIAISFKFFSWYKDSNFKTPVVLFYAIAALTLGISIAEDAGTKLLMVYVVEEKTPVGAPNESSFLYKQSEKYDGQIVYREVKADTTTLYVIPNSYLELYNLLNSVVLPVGFVFRWIASTMLLRNIYQKIGKLPPSIWIILSLPLILYLIGKMPGFFAGESLAGIDEEYRYFFRILFRAGTIAGNILFGLAFFIVAKSLISSKIKDYLILAGIGDTIVGISLSTSAIEPTYGVAAHSLVLLSSYLFTLGLYSSAILVSQELKLRQSIRESAIDVSKLLVSIGSAQMEQEIEKKVMAIAQKEKDKLSEHSGIQSSFTEHDMKQYLTVVLKEIKIIQNIDDIIKKGKNILTDSSEFIICSKSMGLRLAYNNYFETFEKIMVKQKNNDHKGIRLVTSISDNDDVDLAYKFLKIGINVRHIKNIPPIDFALSEKEMIATIQKTEGGQLIQNLLTTNERAYIEHFVSIFEELWKSGIDAKYKIKDIEQGIESQGIDVIQNPDTVQQLVYDLIRSAKEEIVGVFSSANAFHRQEYAGTLQLLNERAESKGVNARILVPADNSIILTINGLLGKQLSNYISIRLLEPSMQTKVSILVIDKKHSLVIELKDDTQKTTEAAIGLATYSNSKSTVLSYSSIFENLWKQIELYEQLQIHDKMQKEFINIAAHELRTPIQPILGLTDLLKNSIKDEKQKELLEVINRNAQRLKKLSEDILEVSKMECNSIDIDKEHIRIKEIILDNINCYKNNIENKNIKFEYISTTTNTNTSAVNNDFDDNDLTVYANKNSISRVISNLISNSIKFIPQEKGGIISIIVERKKITENDKNSKERVIVSVEDNGTGIDPEIVTRLFTKFASKSFQGTGLGLYISKKIIESHGGKIWGKSNMNKKGATFSFSLPLNI
ncbi:MAG: HAMP domain-containing histidine kinase [Nitrosopumilus sp.]|nr:HAMP domain-containing histidine kinase [Nitrosopumilus sp.]